MSALNSPRCARILVHVDLTDTSVPAVEYARTLAAACGATLHFLHVVTEPLSAGGTSEMNPSQLPEVQQAMEVEAEQWLDSVLPEEEQERFEASLDVETGDPSLEIVRCADEQAADLVIVRAAREGRPNARDTSIGEDVLRRCKCSVLVVRA